MDRAFARVPEPEPARRTAPRIVHETVRASGQPLEAHTQAVMGARFDRDFSRIRVHADARAAESASAVNASAYTVGQNIVFGAGKYRPHSADGRRLLVHELAHAVQQANAPIPTDLPIGTRDDPGEREARDVAAGGDGRVAGRRPVVLRRSPLTDDLTTSMAAGGKGRVFDRLRRDGPIASDPDLQPWLDKNVPPGTDDRWLADQLIAQGAEPRWTSAAFAERERRASAGQWAAEGGNIEADFDVGAHRPKVPAYYFPGKTTRHAMIVGGVHGTEAAGVQVVELLLGLLRKPDSQGKPRVPTLSVIVVPTLFPENYNIDTKRRSRLSPGGTDPNRNMPARGALVGARVDKQGRALDTEKRPILPENLVLLDLVDRFHPERIAMVHGVWGGPNAGVSTDPRPGHDQAAATDPKTGAVTPEGDDLALARTMGTQAIAKGAKAPLNARGSVTYPTQQVEHQSGTTFGMYGSQAAGSRPAMNVILIETLGNQRSDEIKDQNAAAQRKVELQAFATVLRDIFLEQP